MNNKRVQSHSDVNVHIHVWNVIWNVMFHWINLYVKNKIDQQTNIWACVYSTLRIAFTRFTITRHHIKLYKWSKMIALYKIIQIIIK